MRRLGGTSLLLIACTVLARSTAAQTDDVYCARLAELAVRYTGKVGLEGELKPTKETVVAIEACRQGNHAAGIPVLEKTLRDNRIPLPAR